MPAIVMEVTVVSSASSLLPSSCVAYLPQRAVEVTFRIESPGFWISGQGLSSTATYGAVLANGSDDGCGLYFQCRVP